jgi:PGF-CTERM protein
MTRISEDETVTAVLIAGVLLLSVGMAGPAAVATDTATQPQPPMPLYGQATINGDPLPAGTTIVAEIEGEVRGSITIEEAGRYGGPGGFGEKLSVSGALDDEGKTVRFYVDDIQASETITWSPGDLTQLDLSFASTEFSVSDLSAPASAVQGETITVSATVSNVGDVVGTTDAEFVFAGDVLLNQTVTLGGGNSTQVSFDVPTADVPAGTYEHGVQAGGDSRFANITIQQPATFEVSDLSAPASATAGETIVVNATVSNAGDIGGTTDAEFVFAGDVLLNQTITLGGGNSTQVSFDVPTTDIPGGTYKHGVRAGNSFSTAQINLNVPPTASFSTSVDTVEVNETVTLDGANSTDPDGTITSYEWDLDGNGVFDDATGSTAVVTFSTTGEQVVELRVTDDNGATDTATVVLNVTERSDTVSQDAPGFGVGVALAALLTVVLFARRRI